MKDPPAGTLLGPVAGAIMAPQLRSRYTQFVEQALDPFADGRTSFDLALPPAFTRVVDQRLLDVDWTSTARRATRHLTKRYTSDNSTSRWSQPHH